MKKTFPLLICTFAFFSLNAQSIATFINEVNYLASNPANRGLEIAGAAGSSLNGWSAVVYNLNGTVNSTKSLGNQVIPSQQNGYGTIWYDVDQNSDGGGFALVNPSGVVEQFISYGGTLFTNYVITATQGPAAGMTSQAIGKQLLPTAALQLTGIGTQYSNFIWGLPLGITPGGINLNQTFGLLPQLLIAGQAGIPETAQTAEIQALGTGNNTAAGMATAVEITAFPLPVSDKLHIRLTNALPQPVSIRLFNINGQLLESVMLEAYSIEAEMDMSSLPAGQYVLRVDGAPSMLVPKN